MARTLTATKVAHKESKNSNQDDVLAVCWSCTAELYLIGRRTAKLAPLTKKLNDQLNHPLAASRDGHGAALQRYAAWTAELAGHEMRRSPVMANLSRHYAKLNERNRLALIENEGWSRALDADQFARETWDRFAAGGDWPLGEAGFLDPLFAWLDMQMTWERVQGELTVEMIFADWWNRGAA